MKGSSSYLSIAVLLASLGGLASSAEAHGRVSRAELEVAVSPYGEWVHVSRYGRVWRPSVAVGWRPYTEGRWVEQGGQVVWESDEPWGWAAFHYGRWYQDSHFGWVWVVDTDYSPGWVAWSYDDDWIGWVPLPPGATYLSVSAHIGPDWWYFVPRTHFHHHHHYSVIHRPSHYHRIVHHGERHPSYPVARYRSHHSGPVHQARPAEPQRGRPAVESRGRPAVEQRGRPAIERRTLTNTERRGSSSESRPVRIAPAQSPRRGTPAQPSHQSQPSRGRGRPARSNH